MNWIRRLVREPLVHFLVLGLLVAVVVHWVHAASDRHTIRIEPEAVARMRLGYVQQYGEPPTPEQLNRVLEQYVREEIFLREGVALGLDKDDEIVRRRIAQKFEFLLQDHALPGEPGKAQLRTWYAAHREKFAEPPRRAFDQLYFSIGQRGEGLAAERARAALAALHAGHSPAVGDDFPGAPPRRLLSLQEVETVFGGGDFAARVFAAPRGVWSGP